MTRKKPPMVVVDVSAATAPTPPASELRYAILIDRNAHQILTFARSNPKVYVFVFFTAPSGEIPDVHALLKPSNRRTVERVLMPYAIGDCNNPGKVIRQVVHGVLDNLKDGPAGKYISVMECVKDETPAE
jgi:hypothetical protein